MVLSISFPIVAEYVRHLPLRAVHGLGHSEVLRRSWGGLNGNGTREQVEWTGSRTDFAGSDVQVASGGRQTAMAKQQLDGPDVRA